jgi:hypothetical protein
MRRAAAVAFILASIAAVSWSLMGAKQGQVSDFEIIVEPNAAGLSATCNAGCAWKSLSFGCGEEAQSCRVKIDEHGVGPAGEGAN